MAPDPHKPRSAHRKPSNRKTPLACSFYLVPLDTELWEFYPSSTDSSFSTQPKDPRLQRGYVFLSLWDVWENCYHSDESQLSYSPIRLSGKVLRLAYVVARRQNIGHVLLSLPLPPQNKSDDKARIKWVAEIKWFCEHASLFLVFDRDGMELSPLPMDLVARRPIFLDSAWLLFELSFAPPHSVYLVHQALPKSSASGVRSVSKTTTSMNVSSSVTKCSMTHPASRERVSTQSGHSASTAIGVEQHVTMIPLLAWLRGTFHGLWRFDRDTGEYIDHIRPLDEAIPHNEDTHRRYLEASCYTMLMTLATQTATRSQPKLREQAIILGFALRDWVISQTLPLEFVSFVALGCESAVRVPPSADWREQLRNSLDVQQRDPHVFRDCRWPYWYEVIGQNHPGRLSNFLVTPMSPHERINFLQALPNFSFPHQIPCLKSVLRVRFDPSSCDWTYEGQLVNYHAAVKAMELLPPGERVNMLPSGLVIDSTLYHYRFLIIGFLGLITLAENGTPDDPDSYSIDWLSEKPRTRALTLLLLRRRRGQQALSSAPILWKWTKVGPSVIVPTKWRDMVKDNLPAKNESFVIQTEEDEEIEDRILSAHDDDLEKEPQIPSLSESNTSGSRFFEDL